MTNELYAPTISRLQVNLPWTIRYSQDFRSNPQPHKDFAHALHHASKALGALHGLADDMDHNRHRADDPELVAGYGKYVADLVVCALRIANTFPGGVIDLEKAVIERIETKNDVKLSLEPRTGEIKDVDGAVRITPGDFTSRLPSGNYEYRLTQYSRGVGGDQIYNLQLTRTDRVLASPKTPLATDPVD